MKIKIKVFYKLVILCLLAIARPPKVPKIASSQYLKNEGSDEVDFQHQFQCFQIYVDFKEQLSVTASSVANNGRSLAITNSLRVADEKKTRKQNKTKQQQKRLRDTKTGIYLGRKLKGRKVKATIDYNKISQKMKMKNFVENLKTRDRK